jgi:hypothetical protein
MPRMVITMPFKRHLPLLASFLGLLGVVVCVAGIAAVWSIGSQLSRTREHVFDGIDETLAAVRDRVLGAQRRVQESKITTEDIEQSLRDWTRKETSERLASRLKVEEKAGQLALRLQQADLWLQISGASIQGVQQTLEVGSSIGAPVDAALINPLLAKLALLRSQLKQATKKADEIRERAAEIANGESLEERIDQAVQLTLRAVLTLGEIDSRLGEFADRVSEIQAEAKRLRSKALRWIVTATIVAVLLIGWMGVGQASLCLHGWKGYRRTCSTI